MSKLAVILIRGRIGFHYDVKHTLDLLKLQKKHTCVIIEDNASNKGMLQKVKDAVTWGAIDDATLKELQEKRGTEGSNVYHLQSPKGGFERKGIKKPFNLGGALGNRKEKINDLIKNML